jgi:rare lipoprotein A
MIIFAPATYPGRRINSLLFCISVLAILAMIFATSAQASGKRPRTQESYVIKSKRYYPIPSAEGYSQKGIASWYGGKFHGRRTSNGEIYNKYLMTAAHKTLPMNTMLLVKNLENGKKTVVRINDRGPFVRGRIVDLSYKAAKELEIVKDGTARIQATALGEATVTKWGESPTLLYADLSVGEFYVQIGAFAQKTNAAKLQKRFTDAGHTTVTVKFFGPESILYRVQVYAGKTLAKAKRAEKNLLENGYVGAFSIAR